MTVPACLREDVATLLRCTADRIARGEPDVWLSDTAWSLGWDPHDAVTLLAIRAETLVSLFVPDYEDGSDDHHHALLEAAACVEQGTVP